MTPYLCMYASFMTKKGYAIATWTDPVEAKANVPVKTPTVRFMYALEP